MKKHAVISLSGGMDSSTLLLRLLREGYEVQALSFDYGQKHKVELEKAKELIQYINDCILLNPFIEKIKIKHQIIKLDGLSQLLNSSLVEGGSEVPEGHYEQNNMKDTVVPNRNKIFSSIIQAVALSLHEQHGTNVKIAMGIHSGDHAIYPDCRQEFRDADFKAFQLGNWNSEYIQLYTPYLQENKFTILKDGEQSCIELGLDFDEVYKRTLTSYKPIFIPLKTGYAQDIGRGIWYSDYKSASSVERSMAFIELGRPDPINFADETGPVSWEVAKQHALKIEKDFRVSQR